MTFIEYYPVESAKPITKEIEDSKVDKFISLVQSGNFETKYNKIWILDDKTGLNHIIRTGAKPEVINVSDIKLTESLVFERGAIPRIKSLSEYHKFICAAWGALLYMDYPLLPEGKPTDVLRFFNQFSPTSIKALTDAIINDASGDDSEWVQEGLKMDGITYLTRAVIDRLFSIGYQPLLKPLVIYRTWNSFASEIYTKPSWVSTTLKPGQYGGGADDIEERYILPTGTCIINTKIDGIEYADNNEIIVRTEDLFQL